MDGGVFNPSNISEASPFKEDWMVDALMKGMEAWEAKGRYLDLFTFMRSKEQPLKQHFRLTGDDDGLARLAALRKALEAARSYERIHGLRSLLKAPGRNRSYCRGTEESYLTAA